MKQIVSSIKNSGNKWLNNFYMDELKEGNK